MEKIKASIIEAPMLNEPKVAGERSVEFHFYSCGTIPPPVVMVQNVSFRYSESTPYIYKDLEFGLDLDTRLALVGPNGAGKSTLLKLIYGEVRSEAGVDFPLFVVLTVKSETFFSFFAGKPHSVTRPHLSGSFLFLRLPHQTRPLYSQQRPSFLALLVIIAGTPNAHYVHKYNIRQAVTLGQLRFK